MARLRHGHDATRDGERHAAGVRENNGKPYGNPVPKYWTATGPYNQIYYGRGHVQLTWDYNYQKGGNPTFNRL